MQGFVHIRQMWGYGGNGGDRGDYDNGDSDHGSGDGYSDSGGGGDGDAIYWWIKCYLLMLFIDE